MRRKQGCKDYAELRSAYVDGGLKPVDVDRLTAHLATCSACVRDVAELRRVRALLSTGRSAHPDLPPDALAARLVNIAGLDAAAPLWSRPFRRVRRGALPSSRRRRQRRTAAGAAVSVTLATSVAVAGYVAAPAAAVVVDPTMPSQSDFSAVLSQLPLGSDALATAMVLRSARLRSDAPVVPADAPTGPTTLNETDAVAELQRAEQADASVSYEGVQAVVTAHGSGSLRAVVDLTFTPADGTAMTLRSSDGTRLLQATNPAPAAERGGEDDSLHGLAERYALSGVEQVLVLGRYTTLVTARATDGTLASRWWIDATSGLLLRHEAYAGGRLQTSVGFTRLSFEPTAPVSEHTASRLTVPQTTAAMTLSTAPVLARSGWSCGDQLAGLSLVRLRSDSDVRPGVLHMVYTDGVETVSVFERKGRLDGAPSGTELDPDLGAYVSDGFARSATWESDGTVFTVVTDGPDALRDEAVLSLPRGSSAPATTMERIRAGWSRLLHLSTG